MPGRGVFGGTFNPIHLGHLLLAEEVRTVLGLAEIIFVPTGLPWMKEQDELASADDRWAMVNLAIASNPAFTASRVDIDRPGPSYAVDTVKDLLAGQPGACDLFFIMGVDSLEALPRWKEPQEMLRLCRIAVVSRPGYDVEATAASLRRALPEAVDRLRFVEGLRIDISSTDIRRRRREGRSIRYRVPEAVEAYIMARGLYHAS